MIDNKWSSIQRLYFISKSNHSSFSWIFQMKLNSSEANGYYIFPQCISFKFKYEQEIKLANLTLFDKVKIKSHLSSHGLFFVTYEKKNLFFYLTDSSRFGNRYIITYINKSEAPLNEHTIHTFSLSLFLSMLVTTTSMARTVQWINLESMTLFII